MTNLFASTVSAITRLACLGFVVVAGMTIPQAWDLLDEHLFNLEGNVMYVPIVLCGPSSITIENTQLNFNIDNTNEGCHTLQYFINASVASMFFSGAAILIFIIWDALSKYFTGPIAQTATVIGMGLVLIFILFQTAAVNYALYNECNYWEDYYMDRFKEAESSAVISGYTSNLDLSAIQEVQTYGNPFFFFLTCVMALVCSGLLLLDVLVGLLFRHGTKPKNDEATIDPSTADSSQLKNSTSSGHEGKEAEHNEDPLPEQPPDHRNWTSY